MLGAFGKRHRCGRIEKSHKQSKHHPIGTFVEGVVETLVAGVVAIHAGDVIGFAFDGGTSGSFVHRLGKQVSGDTHLRVIGFAGEHGDGLVLGLPSEASDRAVVGTTIGYAANSECAPESSGFLMAHQNLAILDTIENSEAEKLRGNTESQIAILVLRLK